MIFKTRTTLIGLIASASLLFAGSPAANAGGCSTPGPTTDQYCPPATTIEQGDPGLPFTGYDVGLAALAAVGLVGAGIGLHRAARVDEGT